MAEYHSKAGRVSAERMTQEQRTARARKAGTASHQGKQEVSASECIDVLLAFYRKRSDAIRCKQLEAMRLDA